MSRRFIAAVLAASLSITAWSAAPARADGKDAARVLGTAATLFILGKTIADARGEDRVDWRFHTPQGQRHRALPEVVGRGFGNRPRHDRRRVLPSRCVFEVRGGGMRYVLGQGCLQRNGVRVNRLPRECLTRVRTGRGVRPAYVAGCLRRDGYRLDRDAPRRGDGHGRRDRARNDPDWRHGRRD
ncbi:hypothetical protein [Salipiger mucosus]|uniref:Uncharacterized protein n=1 Tax=Salipiger mucosus DSM 16094 TaxID=1123237 RepID=S9SL60_9RHOB|nr:hypothetical protein [Salipiger mucosus]EPX87089.1 hypothetical protein Salmuc_00042 [Salipiger mucosus DSM 16094]